MKRLSLLGWICQLIIIVAGIDWGLIALFKIDLVTKIFGTGSITRIVYIVVGAAAVFVLLDLIIGKPKKA
jgi:uncharacterized membrane protein YuzA (DUF378 family)